MVNTSPTRFFQRNNGQSILVAFNKINGGRVRLGVTTGPDPEISPLLFFLSLPDLHDEKTWPSLKHLEQKEGTFSYSNLCQNPSSGSTHTAASGDSFRVLQSGDQRVRRIGLPATIASPFANTFSQSSSLENLIRIWRKSSDPT
nr:uncharacterized protein LOC109171150 [Ipomoea trifida]